MNPYESPKHPSPVEQRWPRILVAIEVACWAFCLLLTSLLFVWWTAEHVWGIGFFDANINGVTVDMEHVRYALAVLMGAAFLGGLELTRKRIAFAKRHRD